jgi:XTP/dITP diphosphohydrolase
MPKFNFNKLLIATNNQGKIDEFKALLNPFNVNIISAKEFDIAEPEETGSSFAENAILKAKYYGDITKLPAIADDSGLEVEALNNAPGIYSARWAQKGNFNIAMNRIQDDLSKIGLDKSAAKFVCALAIYVPGHEARIYSGELFGTINFPARGTNGFGYDPIFTPQGYEMTLAEMTQSEKNLISHRKLALSKLIEAEFN